MMDWHPIKGGGGERGGSCNITSCSMLRKLELAG